MVNWVLARLIRYFILRSSMVYLGFLIAVALTTGLTGTGGRRPFTSKRGRGPGGRVPSFKVVSGRLGAAETGGRTPSFRWLSRAVEPTNAGSETGGRTRSLRAVSVAGFGRCLAAIRWAFLTLLAFWVAHSLMTSICQSARAWPRYPSQLLQPWMV